MPTQPPPPPPPLNPTLTPTPLRLPLSLFRPRSRASLPTNPDADAPPPVASVGVGVRRPVYSASTYAPGANASNHDSENGGERNDEAEDGDEEAKARALAVLDMGCRVGRVPARPRLPPQEPPPVHPPRVGKGYWLKQLVMSPYAGSASFDLCRKEAACLPTGVSLFAASIPSIGSMYHGSPLLLLVLGPLAVKSRSFRVVKSRSLQSANWKVVHRAIMAIKDLDALFSSLNPELIMQLWSHDQQIEHCLLIYHG